MFLTCLVFDLHWFSTALTFHNASVLQVLDRVLNRVAPWLLAAVVEVKVSMSDGLHDAVAGRQQRARIRVDHVDKVSIGTVQAHLWLRTLKVGTGRVESCQEEPRLRNGKTKSDVKGS